MTRVLVTRPAAQCADWLRRLREAGIDAVALPLIDIETAQDCAPLVAAWQALPAYRLVMFVSPNAVSHFFAARPPGVRWPDAGGPLAAAPGPGTVEALCREGLAQAAIVAPDAAAAQYDSEALWARLRTHDWQGAEVLLVRGESGGRDWLADRFQEAGARVRSLGAYRRRAPRPDAAEQALLAAALADPASHLWWFSSSEAIVHLADLAPAQTDWSAARALVTHPRIAERARQLGFGRVAESRPEPAEVLEALRRSIESAIR